MSRKLNQFVLSLIGIVCWLTGSSASGAGLDVGGYQVISSTRVGRTDYQYVLTVNITNRVASAAGVTAQVYSLSTNTTIVQGTVSFGDVAFGAITVSSNTITIIQNRLAVFDPGQLQWFVAVKSMPLTVTVNSPVSGFLTGGTNVTVSGTVGPNVDGVLVGPNVAALTGTNYTGNFRLEEGKNTITVLATNSYGGSGLVNIFVTRDTTPPILNIESPTNGAVLSARQVTVIGLINDIVPGTVNPEQATVTVNGLDATLYNRSYAIQNILLVPGKNTITAVGRDRAGNQSQRQIEVTFTEPASQKRLVRLAGEAQTGVINTTLPLPLLVELVDSDGVVQTNQPVTFAIVRNDGTLFASPDTGRTLTVLTDDKGQARVFYQLGTRSGVANNQVDVTSPGVDGHVDFCANALGAPPTKISPLIPETQSGEVSRPLPLPWTAYVTDGGGNPVASAPVTFLVSQGGGSFAGVTTVTTNTDTDGRASAILTLGPDEGVNNNVVLASVPGLSNSSAVFTASSQTPGAVADTRVVGVVLDNGNHPMSNILCMIRGSVRATVTDQEGQFILTHAPVGAITLIIDGRNRGYPGEWHDLTFNMSTVAGRDNRLDRPIYMVQVDSASSMLVGGSEDVTLHLTGFPGSSLTVYAHSLRDANNQPITNQVTWTQVNAERIPMAPPQGSQPVLTTAILPSGYRFNPPARMCIPNASGLPAGQILELYSFDHDIGSFVSVGTATVSSDASLICSDPGFGVMKSGWHPVVPPPPPCTPVCGAKPADTDCIKYDTEPPKTKCDCPTYPPKEAKILKVEAKVEDTNAWVTCTNVDVHFSFTEVHTNCSGVSWEWDFKDGTAKTIARSPTHKFAMPGDYEVEVTVKCISCTNASLSGKVKVGAAVVTFAKAPGEDAANNAWGYDDFDTTNSFTDDHVSVKNGGDTYVQVTITGTTMFDKVFMVSKDEAKVKVDPANAPSGSFKLKVSGQADKAETMIEAHGGKKDGPLCSSENANSYKLKEIAKWTIYRITDSTSAGTAPLTALVAADLKTFANGIIKYGVMNFADVDVSDKDIAYDVNKNGALEYYYDGGAQTELSVIQAAGLTGNPKLAVVKNVNFAYRLAAAVAAGTNKFTVIGSAYLADFANSGSFYLGLGADKENVSLTSVVSNVVTLAANLTKAHPSGETLFFELGAGASADPQVVEDGAAVNTTLLHETLHRSDVANVLDLDSIKNIMNYTTGVGHTEFRYKPQPKHYSPFGDENQWETIPRP